MKLLVLLLFVSTSCFAQYGLKKGFIAGGYTAPPPPPAPIDYYISATGIGTACSAIAPCSFAFAKTQTYVNGDRFLFNRGDEFLVSDWLINGVSDIQIIPYGTGVDPKITGSIYLGGATWTSDGSGNYYTSFADPPNWLQIGGVDARLAESAWYPIDAAPSAGVRSIAAATLAGLSNTVGAKIISKQYDFRATEVSTITAEDDSNGNLTFSPALPDNGYAAVGLALKIMNQAQFATTQGDWWYDDLNERIYIKSATTPSGTDIRITTGTNVLQVFNCTNLLIDNIEFRHGFKNVIELRSCVNPTTTNLTIHDFRGSGIRINGVSSNWTCTDNLIYNGGLRGLEYAGVAGLSILRNTIHGIGVGANIGHPYDDNLTGGTAITMGGNISAPSTPINGVISENILYNLGYQGVQWWGYTFQITKNIIYNFGLKWNDGGAIHTFYISALGPGTSTSNGLIEKNVVRDGVGDITGTTHTLLFEGIYIDYGCNDILINDNAVYRLSHSGILCNWNTNNITITNNKLMGTTFGVNLRQWLSDSPNWSANKHIVTDNITGAMTSSQRNVKVESFDNSDTYNPFSSPGSANNNHHVNPYTSSMGIYKKGTTVVLDLAGWRTRFSSDAASTFRNSYISFTNSTNAAQETKIEVNETGLAVNFNVPAGYSDYSGVAFSNPVSIAPYSSLMYFKNTAFP